MTISEEGPLHSPLGPSAAERWIRCPGSVLLTRDLPDVSTEYAIEGSAAHIMSEWARNENAPASAYRGRKVLVPTEQGDVEFIVDDEMVHKVQEFLDYVDQFEGDPFYELRVSYTDWVPGGFGTSDDIRIEDGVCRVTDLKYGKGIQVFAEENSQLMLYALGTYQELGMLYEFDRVVLSVCQPRLDHIDEWETSIEDIIEWAEEVARPAAEIALKPGAPLAAGDHCTFCKVRHTCPERAKANLKEVVGDFEDLDALAKAEMLDFQGLSNNVLADILGRLPDIRKWCTDLEKHALDKLKAGIPIGDWKLVRGRSNRKWRDEEEAEAELRKIKKLRVSDIVNTKVISPTEATRLLGPKHRIIRDLVIKPLGKPALAPGDDPREAINVTPSSEFEDLDAKEEEAEDTEDFF